MTYAPPTPRKGMTQARVARIFIACGGKCAICGLLIRDGEKYDIEHPSPLWAGGSDDDDKLTVVHVKCHRAKTGAESAQRAKRNAQISRGYVGKAPSRKPMPGGRASPYKIKIGGRVVLRHPKQQDSSRHNETEAE